MSWKVGCLKAVWPELFGSVLGVWAVPGVFKTIQTGGGLRPPSFWVLLKSPGAAQTPKTGPSISVQTAVRCPGRPPLRKWTYGGFGLSSLSHKHLMRSGAVWDSPTFVFYIYWLIRLGSVAHLHSHRALCSSGGLPPISLWPRACGAAVPAHFVLRHHVFLYGSLRKF